MSNLVRFGVSLEKELLKKFDGHIKNRKYTNRSEAIRDLIQDDWSERNGRTTGMSQELSRWCTIIIQGSSLPRY